jgi:hypothetical protein
MVIGKLFLVYRGWREKGDLKNYGRNGWRIRHWRIRPGCVYQFSQSHELKFNDKGSVRLGHISAVLWL